jgi:hypothetical protein
MHPMLRRLDDLAAHLSTRDDAIALLGLGSAGVEHDRMDDHSDLDFFVIVRDGAKPSYLDAIDWLSAAHPVAYSFANDPNGRKALFADGIFVEYAIFTPAELARLPFTGARVVWSRPDAPPDLAGSGPAPAGPPYDTVEFHLNEALTNIYVGLHRELRGERLTAARFIQSFAVDRVIALQDLSTPGRHRRDPFEPSRRVEQAYGDPLRTAGKLRGLADARLLAPAHDELPLGAMVPGYEGNWAAARVTFDWLRARFAVDPVIADAIEGLLAQVTHTGVTGPMGTLSP